MYILNTDHFALLRNPTAPAATALVQRLRQKRTDRVVTTVVTYQEQMQGWMAFLNRARTDELVVHAYDELAGLKRTFERVEMLRFDEAASQEYQRLRVEHRRLGTLDLRIAAIALSRNGTVLTRNLRDFQQVPGLAVEDWTA